MMLLRPISHRDDAAVASLIRTSLEEFSLDKDGTAYFDTQLDHLTDYYAKKSKSAYFVIEAHGDIVACAGYGFVSEKIAELQKLYVAKSQRGKGYSTYLLKEIFQSAKADNYNQLYLETARELAGAVSVYERFGFEHLMHPLANEEGHAAMDIWMLKDLD